MQIENNNHSEHAKNRVWDCLCIATIFFVVLLQVFRIGNLPGLYLDAINPDYITVQLIYPSDALVHWMAAWPWLCQVYHGTITAFLTWLSIIITGTTSVLQHHIVYGIVIGTASTIVYMWLKDRDRLFAFLSAILLATVPAVISLFCTQYYVELFGTICALISLLLAAQWKENHQDRRLILSYLLLGVAFYSYFNYLFFLPSILLFTAIYGKTGKMRLLIRCMVAFLAGCGFYFIGYTQIWINQVAYEQLGVLLTAFAVLYYAYLIFLYRSTYSRKKIWLPVALSVGAVILGVWAWLCLPHLKAFMDNLEVDKGMNEGLRLRLAHIIRYIVELFSGRAGEKSIYQEPVTMGSDWYTLLMGLAMLLSAIGFVLKKKDTGFAETIAWMIYALCSLVLSARMQSQHFVPLLFLGGIIIGKSIIAFCNGAKRSIRIPCVILLSCIVLVNMQNDTRIIERIKQTGGDGLYTYGINEMADEALDRYRHGRKETYIFKDWGFLFGFNYLTQNQVETTSVFDENIVGYAKERDHDIVVCYWNEADRSAYEEVLRKFTGEGDQIMNRTMLEEDGSVAFYMIELIQNGGDGDNETPAQIELSSEG